METCDYCGDPLDCHDRDHGCVLCRCTASQDGEMPEEREEREREEREDR